MLTQFFKSINWVDVALVILFGRVIFISVKNGFIAELFKFLGVITGLFVSLHYYAYLAAWAAGKTTLSIHSWQFLFFIAIWAVVTVAFKFLRDGILLLFKVETTHKGFDQYAAGFLGAGRAIFLCSLTLFALLLLQHQYMHRQAVTSYAYKISAHAAPNTYKFFYQHVIGKLFEGERFNEDVFAVVSGNGSNPK